MYTRHDGALVAAIQAGLRGCCLYHLHSLARRHQAGRLTDKEGRVSGSGVVFFTPLRVMCFSGLIDNEAVPDIKSPPCQKFMYPGL